jgi:hypothetical protein
MHVASSSGVASSSNLIGTFDLRRIESNLIERKHELVQASSWVMNLVILAMTIVGFGLFLYSQYNTKPEEVKRIPFEPVPWLSATRNVRMEEYGRQLQPREAQIGHGLPESIGGDGFSSVYGDYTSLAARD